MELAVLWSRGSGLVPRHPLLYGIRQKAFFRGASLRPVPPGMSKGEDTRCLDIHENDQLDEAQLSLVRLIEHRAKSIIV